MPIFFILQFFLQADREKEAAREKEEADRLAKEAEERKQKEKADKIREARVRKLSARLPPEPKDEKAEGRPVSQLRFRIPATHTREEDGSVSNGETKSGKSKRVRTHQQVLRFGNGIYFLKWAEPLGGTFPVLTIETKLVQHFFFVKMLELFFFHSTFR